VTFHCQFVNNMFLCIVTLNVNGIAVVGVEKIKLISCVYKKHNVLLMLNQNGKINERGVVELRKYLENNNLINVWRARNH
jgi:hypothetical protein